MARSKKSAMRRSSGGRRAPPSWIRFSSPPLRVDPIGACFSSPPLCVDSAGACCPEVITGDDHRRHPGACHRPPHRHLHRAPPLCPPPSFLPPCATHRHEAAAQLHRGERIRHDAHSAGASVTMRFSIRALLKPLQCRDKNITSTTQCASVLEMILANHVEPSTHIPTARISHQLLCWNTITFIIEILHMSVCFLS
jgi:hypothetical protein